MGNVHLRTVGGVALDQDSTPFSVTVDTADDHEVIAAPAAGRRIIIEDMQIQVQGDATQEITIMAGETVLRGPFQVTAGQVITVGQLGGFRLPRGAALVVTTSEAEDVLITGGYVVL